eukprot:gene15892-21545_t
MRAHAERPGAIIGPHPPQEDRHGEEEAGDDEPAALLQGHERTEPVLRAGRRQLQPEELADEANRIPVHRGQHVEADDLERDEAADERGHPGPAEIDRADLGVADHAEQVAHPCGGAAARAPPGKRDAEIGRAVDLNPGEDNRAASGAGLVLDGLVLGLAPPLGVRPHGRPRAGASAPDREMARQVPPLGPALAPVRAADDDADRAPEHRRQRQEETEPVDAECADRIADRVAEEAVLVLGRLDRLAPLRVGRRQDQSAMQRKRERRGEEERHRDHVGGIIVELEILVADVRDPLEMAEDAIGETVAPGAEQERPEDHQRHIGQDGEAEGDGHVIAHAELAADLDLAQGPGDEGSRGADRDDLPEPALEHRGEGQAIFGVRRRDVDQPRIPRRSLAGTKQDQGRAEPREEDGRDAEEANIEGADPEIEQIAANQRAAPDPVFSLEIEQCHRVVLPAAASENDLESSTKICGARRADVAEARKAYFGAAVDASGAFSQLP